MANTALQVVDNLEAAATMMSPLRLDLLKRLRTPNSATGLAKQLEQPRQKINYHLRALESAGLVELVETRRRRNCEERIVRATASSYLVSPEILGSLGANPGEVKDRFSSGYLLAVLAEALRDVSFLRKKSQQAKQKLATITMQTKIRFASAEKRNQFATELAQTVAKLTARYNDDTVESGRSFNFSIAGYPAITKPELKEERKKQHTMEPEQNGENS